MKLPLQKSNRLKEYDYSTPNAYFITICSIERRCIFWNNVGATIGRPKGSIFSPCGLVIEQAINRIPAHYPAISVDNYVIMPNHVHLLLQIHSDSSGRPMVAPTISNVIQQLKGQVSKQVGAPVWQKGFYDHVVRSSSDYREIWEYIDNNPIRWTEDKLYSNE